LVKNDEQAEDIVANAFIKLWRNRTGFENLDGIRAFMHVAIKNASLNYLRDMQRRSASHKEIYYLAEKGTNYIENRLIKMELLQMIFEEVETLPPIRRRIFKMIYLEDLTVFEIASQLNITTDTVRVQKARALHALRSTFLKKGILVDFSTLGAGVYFIYFL
jgi:RNA polymerase sigma-70 factor (ECF subfamily)